MAMASPVEIVDTTNADLDAEMEAQLENIEEEFRCPLTHELMIDPVRIIGEHESQIFERSKIEEWIAQNNGRYIGPLTRKVIRKPRLVSCEKRKQEILAYKECKAKLIEASKKQSNDNSDNDARMTLDEIARGIDRLEELGAWEIAEPLRQRYLWIREYVMSKEGRRELASYAVSGAIGATAAGVTIATCGSDLVAAGVGGTVSTAAKLTIDQLRANLARDEEATVKGTQAYYQRVNQRLDQHPEQVEQIASETREVAEIVPNLGGPGGLGGFEEDVIDSMLRLATVIGLGAVGGAAGYGLSTWLAGSAAEGGAAVAAEGTVTALLAASPAGCALVCGALVGFSIFYVGNRRGWWVKKKKTKND